MDSVPIDWIPSACIADRLHRYKQTTELMEEAGIYPEYHRLDSAGTLPTCRIGGRELVMLCSNNYLGLAHHPRVLEAAREMLEVHGTGPGGSRCMCGNIDILENLESFIADFMGTEDAITFPTGYMANVSAFRALLDPVFGNYPHTRGTGTVLIDECSHATTFDGTQLCSARCFPFQHNDLEDLERRLKWADPKGPRVVVVEGAYALEGEMAPLPEILDLCARYGAISYVDDAHGIGTLGPRGGGALEHFALEGRADLVMGSFDKALGGMGGFVAGRRDVIRYLRVAARAYIFSSSVPATMAGAMLRALEIARGGDLLRHKLRRNFEILKTGLLQLGFQVLGNGTVPVAPTVLGDEGVAVSFQKRLFELGVFAVAFRAPAVPKGLARIRVTPTAMHDEEHLRRALEAFATVGRELGVVA
jgi:8-amino-7-oxononanoate synthase